MTHDLHAAIANLWEESGLDEKFREHWVDDTDEFLTLNDQEAHTQNPFPYCIYSIEPGPVMARMTGPGATAKEEFRSYSCRFTIHAQQTQDKSAKEHAAYLAEEIVKVFGGHPTVAPQTIDGVYQVSLTTDQGIRTESQNYSWMLDYDFQVDNRVAY